MTRSKSENYVGSNLPSTYWVFDYTCDKIWETPIKSLVYYCVRYILGGVHGETLIDGVSIDSYNSLGWPASSSGSWPLGPKITTYGVCDRIIVTYIDT